MAEPAAESATIPVLIMWILAKIQSRLTCSECYFFDLASLTVLHSLKFDLGYSRALLFLSAAVARIPAKVVSSHFKSAQVSKHCDFIWAMSSTKIMDVENL